MSLALRNLEEPDLQAVQALIAQEAGSELAASSFLQLESLRPIILGDTSFGLIAEEDSKMVGTATVLMEQESPATVLGLLCRLCVPDSPNRTTIAANLLSVALQSLENNLQLCLIETRAADLWIQAVCEETGFIPCGFLPQKIRGETRGDILVHLFLSEKARKQRRPHPEIITGTRDLATEALKFQGIVDDLESRDDATAYPTESNLIFTTIETDAVQTILQGHTQQDRETFPHLQTTQTYLNLPTGSISYMAAKDNDHIVGIIGYTFDPFDKKVQIAEIISLEGDPQGFMVAQLLDVLTREYSPAYWEALVSAYAPRMQKTFDQLGFVTCAYLPAFGLEHEYRSDALKMVKLTGNYESQNPKLTSAGTQLYSIIDTAFREHNVGAAVLKLLRDLRIFRGLGEGELRRVARLFSQKLYRPGEIVVEAGTSGQELYVVERGEIEITTKDGNQKLATLRTGMVMGEIGFLNNEPRTARAVSKSATIVRMIHRSDFDRLIQKEIHLGLIIFQNIALELAEKLKNQTQNVTQTKVES